MAKVLIADDCRRDIEHLETELRRRSHEVLHVGCGRDAQAALIQQGIEFAIYDGYMPRFVGEQVSHESEGVFLARETKRKFPDMRCVVYSHGLIDKHRDDLRKIGVPYLNKGNDSTEEVLRVLGL